MQNTTALTDRLSWIGAQDAQLKVFDIIMETEFGTTYNAYLLKGSEKSALVETVKLNFFEEFRQHVEQIMPLDQIDYLIVNHTEPDHAGSIEKLLDLNPQLTVVCTAPAAGFLKEIVNRDFTVQIVKNGQTLSLGDRTLEFLFLPNLHWPDTMYTLDREDGILFTCDSFGSHYSFDGLLRSEVRDEEGYQRALKYYYDCILAPFRPFVRKALDEIAPLSLKMICPGHGPVLDCRLEEMMETYRQWSQDPEVRNQVVIAYVSAYGYTRAMAECAAQAIEKSGVRAVLLNLEQVSRDEAAAQIAASKGFLLGSPTILNEALPPVWDVLSLLNPVGCAGKSAAVFGSYGWSGEAMGHLEERLKQLRLKVQPACKIRFKPSQQQLQQMQTWAEEFVRQL